MIRTPAEVEAELRETYHDMNWSGGFDCGLFKDGADAIAELRGKSDALIKAGLMLVAMPVRYNGDCIVIGCSNHTDALHRVRAMREALAAAGSLTAKALLEQEPT